MITMELTTTVELVVCWVRTHDPRPCKSRILQRLTFLENSLPQGTPFALIRIAVTLCAYLDIFDSNRIAINIIV